MRKTITEWAVLAYLEGYTDSPSTSGEVLKFVHAWLNSETRGKLMALKILDEVTESIALAEALEGVITREQLAMIILARAGAFLVVAEFRRIREYCAEHGDAIYICTQMNGRWGRLAFSDLSMAGQEEQIAEWVSRGEFPVRLQEALEE